MPVSQILVILVPFIIELFISRVTTVTMIEVFVFSVLARVPVDVLLGAVTRFARSRAAVVYAS